MSGKMIPKDLPAEEGAWKAHLNMPRLDGQAVARLVKERWPHVRVIVLTGSDAADDRRRAEQAGVDAFVEKRQLAETQQLSALIASV